MPSKLFVLPRASSFKPLAPILHDKMGSWNTSIATFLKWLMLLDFKQIFLLNFGESVSLQPYTRSISLPLHSSTTKTPFEVLLGTTPAYGHLRVFVSSCYAHNHVTLFGKSDPRASCCVFLGYHHRQKGYKVYDFNTHKFFFISFDVIFYEHVFPLKSDSSQLSTIVLPLPLFKSPLTV